MKFPVAEALASALASASAARERVVGERDGALAAAAVAAAAPPRGAFTERGGDELRRLAAGTCFNESESMHQVSGYIVAQNAYWDCIYEQYSDYNVSSPFSGPFVAGTVDGSKCYDDFKALCEEGLDGQFLTFSYQIDCDDNKFTFNNYGDCFSKSCDPGKVDHLVQTEVEWDAAGFALNGFEECETSFDSEALDATAGGFDEVIPPDGGACENESDEIWKDENYLSAHDAYWECIEDQASGNSYLWFEHSPSSFPGGTIDFSKCIGDLRRLCEEELDGQFLTVSYRIQCGSEKLIWNDFGHPPCWSKSCDPGKVMDFYQASANLEAAFYVYLGFAENCVGSAISSDVVVSSPPPSSNSTSTPAPEPTPRPSPSPGREDASGPIVVSEDASGPGASARLVAAGGVPPALRIAAAALALALLLV